MKHPKISVVMSVYNGEKHLCEAVDSILNQTFTDFEFIIINDGSTDNTRAILESYSDPRIRLFHQENIGLTRSLNRGLKDANGDLIARMDADDISDPSRFQRQIRYFEQNPEIGFIGTQFSITDEFGKEIAVIRNPANPIEIKNTLLKINTFCHGSVMFQKNLVNIAGYYREKFSCTQDYDLWLRFAEHTKMANLDFVLYKLRRSMNSITRKQTSRQLNYHLLSIELAKERKSKGADSLDMINIDKIVPELRNRYRVPTSKIKQFKADFYMGYCKESLALNYTFNAFTFWFKSFCLKPEKSKFLFLIKNAAMQFFLKIKPVFKDCEP